MSASAARALRACIRSPLCPCEEGAPRSPSSSSWSRSPSPHSLGREKLPARGHRPDRPGRSRFLARDAVADRGRPAHRDGADPAAVAALPARLRCRQSTSSSPGSGCSASPSCGCGARPDRRATARLAYVAEHEVEPLRDQLLALARGARHEGAAPAAELEPAPQQATFWRSSRPRRSSPRSCSRTGGSSRSSSV